MSDECINGLDVKDGKVVLIVAIAFEWERVVMQGDQRVTRGPVPEKLCHDAATCNNVEAYDLPPTLHVFCCPSVLYNTKPKGKMLLKNNEAQPGSR